MTAATMTIGGSAFEANSAVKIAIPTPNGLSGPRYSTSGLAKPNATT